MARRFPPTEKLARDVLANVLVTNDLNDLPAELADRALLCFHMRGALESANRVARFRAWARSERQG